MGVWERLMTGGGPCKWGGGGVRRRWGHRNPPLAEHRDPDEVRDHPRTLGGGAGAGSAKLNLAGKQRVG